MVYTRLLQGLLIRGKATWSYSEQAEASRTIFDSQPNLILDHQETTLLYSRTPCSDLKVLFRVTASCYLSVLT